MEATLRMRSLHNQLAGFVDEHDLKGKRTLRTVFMQGKELRNFYRMIEERSLHRFSRPVEPRRRRARTAALQLGDIPRTRFVPKRESGLLVLPSRELREGSAENFELPEDIDSCALTVLPPIKEEPSKLSFLIRRFRKLLSEFKGGSCVVALPQQSLDYKMELTDKLENREVDEKETALLTHFAQLLVEQPAHAHELVFQQPSHSSPAQRELKPRRLTLLARKTAHAFQRFR